MNFFKRMCLGTVVSSLALGTGILPAGAQAQQTAATGVELNIPPGPVSRAAIAFSQAAGVQLILDSSVANGVSSPGVRGRYPVADGLARLLAGTGLTFRYSSSNVIVIERAPEASTSGARTFDRVLVEGTRETGNGAGGGAFAALDGFGAGAGANGSSDVTATEGTRSLTSNGVTVGGRTPVALKDIPQSASVVTSARLQQQNITNVQDALQQMPGITVQTVQTGQQRYLSRGFIVDSFATDGGAVSTFLRDAPAPDMAQFDHVEVLRGADALFGGAGNPSGTVNLVRKRPLDHQQFSFELQGGSWNNYRGVIDANGLLTEDGRVRQRFVLSYQDKEAFYDFEHSSTINLYGVTEADLGPRTLVRVGGSYQYRDIQGPINFGLPFGNDGKDLQLRRSFSLSSPDDYQNSHTYGAFGQIDHQFSDRWSVVVKSEWQKYTRDARQIAFSNNIASTQVNLPVRHLATAAMLENELTSFNASAALSGQFDLFGQTQKVTLGADYLKTRQKNTVDQANVFYTFPLAQYDPDLIVFPSTLLDGSIRTQEARQIGVYGKLDLKPVSFWHLSLGARLNWFELDSTNFVRFGTFTSTIVAPTNKVNAHLSPGVSTSFDITENLSLYGSWFQIFTPQATFITAEGDTLPPVTGDTYEVGVKGSFMDGKINASLSFYKQMSENRAVQTGFGSIRPGYSCCYVNGGQYQNKGIDFEVGGEVLKNLQVQLSYNYVKEDFDRDVANTAGGAFVTQQPKHQIKLWSDYDAGSLLKGLHLGLGFRLESSRYTVGTACINGDFDTNSGLCKRDNLTVPFTPFNFTQPEYHIFDARIGYDITDALSASLNVTNINDAKYYRTIGSNRLGNFYGEPRAFMLALRGRL